MLTAPAEKPEVLVMAKELTGLFAAHGAPIGYKYARAIIARCPETVRGQYIRFSDAWAWWHDNPNFRPFSIKRPSLRPSGRKKAA